MLIQIHLSLTECQLYARCHPQQFYVPHFLQFYDYLGINSTQSLQRRINQRVWQHHPRLWTMFHKWEKQMCWLSPPSSRIQDRLDMPVTYWGKEKGWTGRTIRTDAHLTPVRMRGKDWGSSRKSPGLQCSFKTGKARLREGGILKPKLPLEEIAFRMGPYCAGSLSQKSLWKSGWSRYRRAAPVGSGERGQICWLSPCSRRPE